MPVHKVAGHRITLKDQTSGNHYKPSATAWPAAGTATVTVPTAAAATTTRSKSALALTRAGKLPVMVGAVSQPHAPARTASAPVAVGKVRAEIRDHASAVKAGINGLLLTLTPDPTAHGGPMSVAVDYSTFKDAFGGTWSNDLQLVQLPACALTTPQNQACQKQTPLASRNNPATSQVTATVNLPQPAARGTVNAQRVGTGPVVVALTALAKSGGAGDYSATPLSPSGSWSAGGSSGDFTYAYPITIPPAAGGLTPSLSLSYDSQSVDGRLASTDNQAGQIGDGWSMEPGSVSRSYMTCSDDPATTGAAPKTSDLCWAGQILHVSFAGHSGDIVQDDTSPTKWRMTDDQGEKVQLIATQSATQNGTYDGDYWKITTPDGVTYYFGRNSIPSYGTTNSAWTVPVYGAHSGDPCYNATFASASCQQAWQWNLDEVIDLHGNAVVYHYNKETNYYGANNGTTGVSYTRGGYLDHIDYGLGNGNTTAPQRVTFATADRCIGAASTCDPIASHTANWPDVPFNLNCDSGASCANHGPSFWTERRITTITTGIYNSTSQTYPAIDTYALGQSFPDPGDNSKATLWLDSITHTGNTGTAVTLPPVTFTGIKLINRYDTGNGYVDLVRYRISGITTETGEQISVAYSSASCATPSDPSTNAGRCFPVYWTPTGQPDPIRDWFNKYVVSTIGDNDATGGAPTVTTNYEYLGTPGWHYDDNEVVKSKYRTWGQWRGYPEVKTRVGSGSDAKTLTDTSYYLGMDGDTLPNSGKRSATVQLSTAVTVPGSATSVTDSDQLAGKVRETVTYNGDGGPVASATVNSYWISTATATRARDGLPALTATMVRPTTTISTSAVTSGATTTWRTTQSTSSYDKISGLLRYTDDKGDISVPAQETCTSTTYAPSNTSLNLVGFAAEVETDQGACATGDTTTSDGLGYPTGISRPGAVISDTRTFYDTNPTALPTTPLAFPQAAPTIGQATVTEQATDYAAGAFTYQVTSATAYESGYGRPTDSWDPLGNKTHTDYTTAAGQTTSTADTNAKGQKATTTVDPTRGLPTAVVDPNGAETDTAYDGLGRKTAVWLPGRAKATQSANTTYGYAIGANIPAAIITKQLNEDGSYTTSTALFDSLLRPRQTQSQTPAGGRLLTDTYYDTRGWAWKTNDAYWDGSATPTTALFSAIDPQVTDQDVITFDGLGRPVLDVSKDKAAVVSQTKTVYGGDRTTVLPPTGGTPTTTVVDARGRTTEVDKYTTAPTVTGDRVTGGNPKTTTSVYDQAGDHGNIDSLTDPGGNKRTYVYNLLGQTTRQTDPDTGTSVMTYDGAGQLKTTTDANHKSLTYDYDILGRKTGEFDGPDDSATKLADWTYDDPNVANSIGHLTAASRYVGGSGATAGKYTQATTGYNVLGMPTGSSVTLPSTLTAFGATTFTYANTYTTNIKLPNSTTYPAGGTLPQETVSTGYNLMGLPTSTGGLSTYNATTTYDAYSRVAQTNLGKLTNSNVLTYQYDEHTGALTEATSTRASDAFTVDDTQYKRDLFGNITRITDTRATGTGTSTLADTQCYSYNLLGRMADAWTATDACAGAPSTTSGTATVGGPDAYWTSWTFDADGNRQTQTEHGTTAGAGDTNTAYTYGQPADHTKQPDTLTSLQVTNPDGTTNPTATYVNDAVGNTTTTPGAGMAWDGEGHLASLTANGQSNPTSYIYDADGNQLLRTDPSGAMTLFLPGQELTSTSGTTTGYRTIPLPDGSVAERFGATTNYGFVLNNDQGTGTIGLDNTAQTPTFRLIAPYGAPRGNKPTIWHDDKGLVGGTTDPTTGLTNLGAREYDPTLGRFISADPILEATDPNQIGGYTYAGDNPVTQSDPSGLRPLGPTDSATEDAEYYANNGMQGSGWVQSGGGWNYIEVHHWGGMIGEGGSVTQVRTVYSRWAVEHEHAPTDEHRQIHLIYHKYQPGTVGKFVAAALGLDDAEACGKGSVVGCALFGMTFVPGAGELKGAEDAAKAARALKDAEDAAKAAHAADEVTRDMQLARMLSDAAKQKGFSGIGSATREEAAKLGESWVGSGYRLASDGRTMISKDGLRQYRPPSFKPNRPEQYGGPGYQANLEWRTKPEGQWQADAHVDITDMP
ncbi:RHS repeat-associated core domain-containing protein [Actinacidiphila paucisporea]|uniref:RHS repeat-associated core domain-containing protein n=1 Tax=Actinacidiphila paucisporea TaxID=310782 RepID=UPI000936F486|nr:RHS repeat-associated core domain-containing protein [Actinacidiphila paucisporea]